MTHPDSCCHLNAQLQPPPPSEADLIAAKSFLNYLEPS
jgi:hypothetical protein